ncbi:VOC family protein [Phyllobacterium endophyticum]|uniref:VOC family protein n=1 Tax=Phyllobacterium endophyticum TaxID=1149773 RepID=UPI0011CA23B2|nr:VOC family protein [Phyllobacterium endophyticum]TXR50736.1 glyoxalase [Phyllobacterium endophyticum]
MRHAQADLKLEVAVIPVSDVDRSKRFYESLGWRLDADFVRGDGSRAVQLTPPGSPCSIHLGVQPNLFLVVPDIDAARAELVERGVNVSEVFHPGDGPDKVKGPDPQRRSYASYASFTDPDNNSWLLQEVTTRLPGRVDPGSTAFKSSSELASALRRAAAAHGEHEKRAGGQHDENWPDWYAEYIVREHSGEELPS